MNLLAIVLCLTAAGAVPGAPTPASPAPGALNSAGTSNSGSPGASVTNSPAPPPGTELPGSTNNVNNANPQNATGITNANPTPTTGTDAIHSPGASLSHSQVLDAQRALSANGFSVTQDGIAGPLTASAVRRFQAARGLPQTGELDNQTVRRLNSDTQSVPPSNKAQDMPSTF